MKPIIERMLFGHRRLAKPAGTISSVPSTLTTHDIESYYLRVIGNCLRRMLVRDEDVELRIGRAGIAESGLTSFSAYVRILRWDPVVMPVLLQNIPVIDARIREIVNASFLLEHTEFAGVWFQATSSTENSPTSLMGMPAELRFHPGAAPLGPR